MPKPGCTGRHDGRRQVSGPCHRHCRSGQEVAASHTPDCSLATVADSISAGSVSSTKCTSDSIGAGTRTSWVTIFSSFPQGASAVQAAPRSRGVGNIGTQHNTWFSSRTHKHTCSVSPLPRGSQIAAGLVAVTTSATPCKMVPQARGLRRSRLLGCHTHESDGKQKTREKPQPLVDWGQARRCHWHPPLERLLSRNPGRCPGSRHTPTLCAFPEAHPSVVFADFVPLTVAGQRWYCTSFPAHSECCEATWLSSTSQLLVHLTTIASALQDKFATTISLTAPCRR